MKLDKAQEEKADPQLRAALRQASAGEVLRAVILLGPEKDDQTGRDKEAGPEPSQFSTRVEYRQALIEQRSRQLKDDLGDTLEALEDLALKPRGGATSRVVVIEGSARQILQSLDLPGVRHASLDRPIRLAGPGQRDKKEPQEPIIQDQE